MKIKVAVKALESALKKLAAVQGKGNLPVLMHARLSSTRAGVVDLSATDLEASLRLSIPAQADSFGVVLLPISRLQSLLSTFEGEVLINVGKNYNITVSSSNYSGKLVSIDPKEFPELPTVPAGDGTPLNLPILKLMGERVAFAIQNTDTQYAIPCGLLESNGTKVTLVGTEGNRLPIASAAIETPAFKFVVPKRALALLAELEGEVVKLFESDIAFFFQTDNVTFSMQKVSAEFPAYAEVLPAGFETEVKLQTSALKTAIARAKVVAENKRPIISLTAQDGVPSVSVAAMSVESGSSEDLIPATVTGPGFRVGVNADFLTDFLGHVDGEITLRVSTADNPLDFYHGDSYRYVVMPVMIIEPEAAEVSAAA